MERATRSFQSRCRSGKTFVACALAHQTCRQKQPVLYRRVPELVAALKGQVEIGRKTLIVVDEAGMLSTRQAHHILQLSERHGAKVVFAGDTRQQQPVEAGPGLRLIWDVAGSVRVDRIRRQKADLEDVRRSY